MRATVRYDHVAFDLDGTLIDSRADLAAATNHVLGSFGLAAIPAGSVYDLVGEGARRLVERALGPARAGLVDEGVARFLAYYRAHLLDATVLYPGVGEALGALARLDVTLSVLSNKPEDLSRAVLAGLGVEALFRDVVGGDSLPRRKPDPLGLRHLAALAGTGAGRMLLVGDSAIDVATARAGGVAFCGVAWGINPSALRAAEPERVIERPEDLLPLVRGDQAGRSPAPSSA